MKSGKPCVNEKGKLAGCRCERGAHGAVAGLAMLGGIFFSLVAKAQTADGIVGINQANTLVRSYFDAGTNLLYGIGGIVGLIGAFKVFSAWNSNNRHDIGQLAAAWFGSCIFLVVVAAVIRSFFGL